MDATPLEDTRNGPAETDRTRTRTQPEDHARDDDDDDDLDIDDESVDDEDESTICRSTESSEQPPSDNDAGSIDDEGIR
jgi:hypothetical protein